MEPGVYCSSLTEHEFERLCREARKIVESPDFNPPSQTEMRYQIKSIRIREARDYWNPEMDALLGTATDEAVGKLIGKPGQTVADRRRAKNIQAFEQRWTPEEDAVLFTDSCKKIAEKLGRSLNGVKHRRRFLRNRENME